MSVLPENVPAHQELVGLEEMFVLYSRVTRSPFVACDPETSDDTVFIFQTEEACTASAKEHGEQGDACFTMRVTKDFKLKVLGDLYFYGFETIAYTGSTGTVKLELVDVVTRTGQAADQPESNRPPENPRMQMAMLYYLQNARRPQDKQNPELIQKMANEAFMYIRSSRYIIPMMVREIDGKTVDQLPGVKLKNPNGDEIPAIPIFTDLMEVDRFSGKQKVKNAVLDMDKLINVRFPENCQGYVINAASTSLFLPKTMIELWKNQAQGGTAAQPQA